jgi:DivIVA domain-containing protein
MSSLTPEELQQAMFPVVKRGYDTAAVDRYLAEIAGRLHEADDFQRAGDEVAAALRGFQGVLADMRDEAEERALRVRTEAEQEAFRVRTEAEQLAVTMRNDAEQEANRTRTTAAEAAERVRVDAEREREELMAHAQSEVRSMLEDARVEREEAKKLAAAVDETVEAKHREFEEYLVAMTTLAENTARSRVTAVLDGYRAEVKRLVAARDQASAALEIVRSSLEHALTGLGQSELDLTDSALVDEATLPPAPIDDDAVEAAVVHALESITAPIETPPGQLI